MKKIKIILSIILMALMIIKILSSNSFAMTTEDIEQYALQGKIAYDSTHGTSATDNFDQYVNLINSNFWASYKSTMNISNYDSVLFRAYYGSSSPYLTYVSLNFFVNTNKNLQITSTGTQDSTGQYIGYIRAVNNNEITIQRWVFRTTQRNGTEWELYSPETNSFTFSNSTSAYKTNESLLFYTGNIINQHNILYYGYNILNKIEANSIFNFNGLTKVADIRIGEFYNAYNVSYRLYALNQNNKDYKAIEYRQLLDSGETLQGRTGELELINIFNKTNSDFCYIEMLDDNNNVICTSNRFTITMSDSGGSSSYAPTYNSSGDQTGAIDISGIIFSIDSQTNIIYSGDQQILNEIKNLESGENLRFQYWVNFFNPSGDNSGLVLNESGDIFGIKYQNIDNFGIFDFLSTTFNSLYNLLFNNSENVTLSMGQFGTLNSADFVINNNSLNGFLYFTINPTLILITIFFYYRFIKMVATINLKVFDSYDIDNNIKLF